MPQHKDILAALNENVPLAKKLDSIHEVIHARLPFIDDITVTVYDPEGGRLKTFARGSKGTGPVLRYETELGSLAELVETRAPRVIDDIAAYGSEGHRDSAQVAEAGYSSSYTMPMFLNGNLFGFLFFNSLRPGQFHGEALELLDVFGHLISLTVINELASIKTLLATVQAVRDISQHRDVETGAHVSRTARYAQLIARQLAERFDLDDDTIEHIFLFSPLHDIGKIGVPDAILHKPGKLDADEFEQMKLHAEKGREIIDQILDDFGLAGVEHIDVLRNIATFHHEAMDGTGYPKGLEGEQIPIEARILGVADVFDALTSRRPYKEAWTNDEAFAMLEKLAGTKLDPDCVAALVANRPEVERIQQRFRESSSYE